MEVASTLASALECLAGVQTEMILLDLGLPDSQGLFTLDSILSSEPKSPVVVLSGMDDEKAVYQAVQQGAQDFLEKVSIDQKGLIRSLVYASERHRLMAELEAARKNSYRLNAARLTVISVSPSTSDDVSFPLKTSSNSVSSLIRASV